MKYPLTTALLGAYLMGGTLGLTVLSVWQLGPLSLALPAIGAMLLLAAIGTLLLMQVGDSGSFHMADIGMNVGDILAWASFVLVGAILAGGLATMLLHGSQLYVAACTGMVACMLYMWVVFGLTLRSSRRYA